jgi:S1-C subfamily serine protease
MDGNDTLYYIGKANGGYTFFDIDRKTFFYVTDKGVTADEGKRFSELPPIEITGSGFFVSETGKIITNKHVAAPWESDLAVDKEMFQRIIGSINTILGGTPNYNPRIIGIHNKIGVFLNNSDWDRNAPFKNLVECNYIKSAAEKEVDLALIQTTNKSLPLNVGVIQSSDIIADKKEIKVGDDIVIMGYPKGFDLATADDKISSSSKYGHISQIRGRYEIQYDAPSFHGASGSPVFNKAGKLVAVNYAGMEKIQGFNFGIIATHINKLLSE